MGGHTLIHTKVGFRGTWCVKLGRKNDRVEDIKYVHTHTHTHSRGVATMKMKCLVNVERTH